MSLDKLRALDDAATPGPWRYHVLRAYAAGDTDETCEKIPSIEGVKSPWGDPYVEFGNEADAQLATLSHLLLPMAEALEEAYPATEPHFSENCCKACTVLRKLEEALNHCDARD